MRYFDDLFRRNLANDIPLSICFSEKGNWPIEEEYIENSNIIELNFNSNNNNNEDNEDDENESKI